MLRLNHQMLHLNGKQCPILRIADIDKPIHIVFDNHLGHIKPNARALFGMFGCKVRLKNAFHILLCDPTSIIFNLNQRIEFAFFDR